MEGRISIRKKGDCRIPYLVPALAQSFCMHAPCGHVVTGDLSIVQNEKLREGPNFREPVSFSWHQNFDIIMHACEAYARQWAKKEDVELDTLSLSRSVMW